MRCGVVSVTFSERHSFVEAQQSPGRTNAVHDHRNVLHGSTEVRGNSIERVGNQLLELLGRHGDHRGDHAKV
jgi:hypothetical protein